MVGVEGDSAGLGGLGKNLALRLLLEELYQKDWKVPKNSVNKKVKTF